MSVVKKGFVVYFNNYPLMASLPLEQRGLLFSVLMVFADRVWRDSSVTLEEVMDDFPGLSPETRMACGFMGEAIRNDTENWINKQESRQQKRQEQGGYVPRTAQKPPKIPMSQKIYEEPQSEAGRKAREDMDRIRRLMDQMKKGELMST